MKKENPRSDALTRKRYPKNELFRLVKGPNGVLTLDQEGTAKGRGVYVLKDLKTIESTFKKGVLRRYGQVTPELEEQLRRSL